MSLMNVQNDPVKKSIDFNSKKNYFLNMKTSISKKGIPKILHNRIVHHMCFWGFFYLTAVFITTGHKSFDYALKHNFFSLIVLIIPVYCHFYILEKYFNTKKYYSYTFYLIIIIAFGGIITDYFYTIALNKSDNTITYLFNILFFLGFTTAIKFAKKGFRQQLEFQEIKAKHLQMELNLLKSQINPHFLFNTLNNLYSMARKQKNQSTANGIAKLSHLMRYMIHDSNVNKIDLKKEVYQINSYIELQKLRFSEEDDIQISLKIEGDVTDQQISPMLLIPFVENAFKHSISIKSPSVIRMHLKIVAGRLEFSVKNTINRLRQNRDDDTSNLGLENVKRRLELLYPDSHDLIIRDDGEHFEIVLRLQIKSIVQ